MFTLHYFTFMYQVDTTCKTINKIQSTKNVFSIQINIFFNPLSPALLRVTYRQLQVVYYCCQIGLAHESIEQCHYISGLCRSLKFTSPVNGYALVGHVIKQLSIGIHASCKNLCTMESQCVSINIGPLINGKVVCELSNSDDKSHSEDLKAKEGFTYRATQVRR